VEVQWNSNGNPVEIQWTPVDINCLSVEFICVLYINISILKTITNIFIINWKKSYIKYLSLAPSQYFALFSIINKLWDLILTFLGIKNMSL